MSASDTETCYEKDVCLFFLSSLLDEKGGKKKKKKQKILFSTSMVHTK